MAMINIIGNIRDGRRTIVGYRLIDVEDKSVIDVTKEQLIHAMKNKMITVENAKLYNNNVIMGKKYALDDLGTINKDGTIRGTAPVVITTRLIKEKQIYFVCSDIHGKLVKMHIDKMTQFCLNQPVINIGGGYRTINLDTIERDKPDHQKIQIEEVRNPDIVWDIPRFELYMRENGYDYEIDKDFPGRAILSGIDSRCKNIKVPKGVEKVRWTSEDRIKLDTVIFASSVVHITDGPGDNATQIINNVYFQRQPDGEPDNARFEGNGLKNLIVAGNYNIPHYNSVAGIYNNSILPYINMGGTRRISSSFNDVKVRNSRAIIKGARLISYSFNKINGLDELNIDGIRGISVSFRGSSIEKLRFVGGDERGISIDVSFDKSPQLREIDWGDKVYEFRYSSFADCPKLENTKIPKFKRIASLAFTGSNIKEVYVPKSFAPEHRQKSGVSEDLEFNRSAFDETTNIIFDNEIHNLTGQLTRGLSGVYTIEENFITIERNCFADLFNLDEVVLGNIREIKDRAFRDSSIKTMDYRNAPIISDVSIECFSGSTKLESVILSDNIRTIGEGAFKGCFSLAKIVMPKDIEEIGEGAFSLVGNSLNFKPTCYIVRGGSTEKLMRRRRIFDKVYVDSIEEGAEYVLGKETASDREIAKFRLLMQNTEFAVLLEDEYIGSVGFVYKLINQIRTERNQYDTGDMKLNTSQFLDKPIGLEHLPHLTIPDKSDYRDGLMYRGIGGDGLSSVFISKCNLITSLTKLDTRVLHEKVIEHAIDNKINKPSDLIYCDDRFKIAVSYIRIYDETLGILYITENGKLIYVTTIAHRNRFIKGVGGLQGDIDGKDKRKLMYPVSEHLIVGDIIQPREKDSLIGRVRVPNKFNDEIYRSFAEDVITLSRELGEKNRTVEYVYSMGTEKVFKIEAFNGVQDRTRSTTKIAGIYSLKDVLGDKKAINHWYKANNSEKINRYLDKLTLDKDTMKSLANSANAYKVPYAAEIMGVSTEIYEKGIKDIRGLSKEIVERITKTGIIEPFNHSIKQVETLNRIHVEHSEATQIGDGSSILLQYQLINATGRKVINTYGPSYYAVGVVQEGFSKNNKNILFRSEVPIETVLGNLYTLGERISEAQGKNNKPIRNISNNRQKADEFTMLLGTEMTYIQSRSLDYGESLTYGVYVQQCSGEVLLMSSYKGNLYAILRFKESKDAFEVYRDIHTLGNGIDKMDLVRLVTDLDKSRSIRHKSDISELRDGIMEGLPDGYPYVGPYYDIFEKAAKQTK